MDTQIAFSTAVFVGAVLQLSACAPAAPSEVVLKCEGKSVGQLTDRSTHGDPIDVAVILKFLPPEFAEPPSKSRNPIEVVETLRGNSLLSDAASPSDAAHTGSLSISEREFALEDNAPVWNFSTKVNDPRSFGFKISRLTGEYSAWLTIPQRMIVNESGRCEPFDVTARKF